MILPKEVLGQEEEEEKEEREAGRGNGRGAGAAEGTVDYDYYLQRRRIQCPGDCPVKKLIILEKLELEETHDRGAQEGGFWSQGVKVVFIFIQISEWSRNSGCGAGARIGVAETAG